MSVSDKDDETKRAAAAESTVPFSPIKTAEDSDGSSVDHSPIQFERIWEEMSLASSADGSDDIEALPREDQTIELTFDLLDLAGNDDEPQEVQRIVDSKGYSDKRSSSRRSSGSAPKQRKQINKRNVTGRMRKRRRVKAAAKPKAVSKESHANANNKLLDLCANEVGDKNGAEVLGFNDGDPDLLDQDTALFVVEGRSTEVVVDCSPAEANDDGDINAEQAVVDETGLDPSEGEDSSDDEAEVVPDPEGADPGNAFEMNFARRRLMISLLFEDKYHSPPMEDWTGKDGTIRTIMNDLGLHQNDYKKVQRVLTETYNCQLSGYYYTGDVAIGQGRKHIIEKDSEWETMVADYKESGLSFKDVQIAVNENRHKQSLPLFRLGAIKGCVRRMVKRIVVLVQNAQGNYDPNSNWARARFNFTLQVLVRAGKVSEQEVRELLGCNAGDPIPDTFNKDKLTPIDPDAVIWWDEVHRDCFTGDMGADVKRQWIFPRNEEGKYDESGGYNPVARVMTFKYNSQTKMSIGVGVKKVDGERVGKRLPTFFYTGTTMKSPRDMLKVHREEWARIKKMGGREWTTDSREEGTYFQGDTPDILSRVTPTRQEALVACGFNNLLKLQSLVGNTALFNQTLENMPKSNGRRIIGQGGLKAIVAELQPLTLLPGNPPPIENWLAAVNPYEARYKDQWEDEIFKSPTHKTVSSVTRMVEHFMITGHDFFRGTEYEGKWFLYHDALSLMTDKETKKWMAEKGHLRYWILPELGLNDDVGNFGGRPVGASPEFMPLDASLNKDIHESVSRHCILSRFAMRKLNEDDPRRFRMTSPTEAENAYKRVLDPENGVAPSSKRIIEDIDGVWAAMKIVVKAKGAYVQGLAERTGRRFLKSKKKMGHGGKREALDPEIAYLADAKKMHPELRGMLAEARAAGL
ncbi:MAG: hypothetical protein GWQ05_21640 [Verrucomicrobiaceae bacterium]|nr:hypothetical protein [Verrucomicrobiaceae bacterium]